MKMKTSTAVVILVLAVLAIIVLGVAHNYKAPTTTVIVPPATVQTQTIAPANPEVAPVAPVTQQTAPTASKEPVSMTINGRTVMCVPDAKYGRSDHVLNPDCTPTEAGCTIDPCR